MAKEACPTSIWNEVAETKMIRCHKSKEHKRRSNVWLKHLMPHGTKTSLIILSVSFGEGSNVRVQYGMKSQKRSGKWGHSFEATQTKEECLTSILWTPLSQFPSNQSIINFPRTNHIDIMSSARVSFLPHTFIREFSSPNTERSFELFYQRDDYVRFRKEENQRWERAYSKKLRKMEEKKRQTEREERSQLILKDDAESKRQRQIMSQKTIPRPVSYRMASAA